MDFVEQLEVLQAARNNPALLALAMVDIVHHTLPDTERTKVKNALLATAVPHWCDSAFLAALLDTKPNNSETLLGHLRTLTVIEPFHARGELAVNVHEATRLALRDHLRTTDIARWKTLSYRAFAHVHQSTEAHSRIEALYHLFATDQHRALISCEALNKEFISTENFEAQRALTLSLAELVSAGWLTETATTVVPGRSQMLHAFSEEVPQPKSRNIATRVRNTSHSAIRLLILDDNEMVRRALRALLHLEPDMTIIGEARTVAEGVSAVERFTPNMVLLDVKLPDATITEVCRRLLAVAPNLRILVLTSCAEDATVMASVQNGAHGYVLKDVRMDDLIHAIRTVASGHGYLDPRVTQRALHWVRTSSHLGVNPQGITRLSPQERLILPLLAEGKTNREIAVHLRLTDQTVKTYLINIFDKLHIKRRAEAVAWFMKESHVPGIVRSPKPYKDQ